MVRMSEDEYNALLKVQQTKREKLLSPMSSDECADCGGDKQQGFKYCYDCRQKRRREYDLKGNVVKVKGHKINKCRYCGLRGDSKDGRRTYTDESQVQWFRCPCNPQEAQLMHVAEVEVADND